MHISNKLKAIFLFLLATVTMGMRLPMNEVEYTVELRNSCEKKVTHYVVRYNGEIVGPGEGKTVGKLGAVIISMPMIIPKIATVSWREENGTPHEYHVPLASKIKTSDILGSGFTIVFSVCDADLTVYFDKDVGQFESKRKTLWSSKNPAL